MRFSSSPSFLGFKSHLRWMQIKLLLPGLSWRFRWFQILSRSFAGVNKVYFQVSGYAFAGLGLQIAPSLNDHRFCIQVSGGLLFRQFAGVNSN